MVQVMNLLQVVVNSAASKLECQTQSEQATDDSQNLPANEASGDPTLLEQNSNQEDKGHSAEVTTSDGKKCINTYDIFLQLPQSDLHNLCSLLGYEGYLHYVLSFSYLLLLPKIFCTYWYLVKQFLLWWLVYLAVCIHLIAISFFHPLEFLVVYHFGINLIEISVFHP